MNPMTAARDAIKSEIKSLTAQRRKLESILEQLGETVAPWSKTKAKAEKPAKKKSKRLRLLSEVADDMRVKIVKAVKAQKDGASRKHIATYLSANGYETGHHYNEPHLNKLVNALVADKSIKRTGEKSLTRYHAA